MTQARKRPTLPPKLKAQAQEMMNHEFHRFFRGMLTETSRWPAIPHDMFVAGLVHGLTAVATEDALHSTTLLQTLIYELQEQANAMSANHHN